MVLWAVAPEQSPVPHAAGHADPPRAEIGGASAEAVTESISVALTGGVATKADLAAMEVRVYRYVHRYMWIVAGTAVSLNVTLTVALLKWLP